MRERLQGVGNRVGPGASAHVQEVRSAAANQVDHVERAHNQTGPIPHDADVPVELYEIQVPLLGFRLDWIMMEGSLELPEVRVAEEGVRIEGNL